MSDTAHLAGDRARRPTPGMDRLMEWMSLESRATELDREERLVATIARAFKARLHAMLTAPERLLTQREFLEREALAIGHRRLQIARHRRELALARRAFWQRYAS